jgi:TolB-like protein/DNA-binding winged helix-turn-helix (wHTH) protein/Tfp pilus assembly protein PilF
MAVSQTTENAPDAPRNDRSRHVDNPPRGFRIADWTVEPVLNRVSRNGEVVRLEPKVMAVLVYLAERPGQAVSREELEEKVWAGSIVSYDALTGAIQKLRKAFRDDSRHPRIIETLSKRGYRLVAPVELLETHGKTQPVSEVASPGILARRSQRIPWFLVITAMVMTAGALAWYLAPDPYGYGPGSGVAVNSIAVLPFDNLSGLPEQEYFSDGMTDDLITGLAKHPDLLVIARDSAFMYKDKIIDLREVAAKLNVQYVLHGSVRRNKELVRINAQLVDASTNTLIWADSYDGTMTRIFELQDKISGEIVLALTEKIGTTGNKGIYREINNPQAYDSFLMGRHHFYLYASRDENLKAREYFEAAVKYDPDYALAYAMLGWTYTYEASNGWSDDRIGSFKTGLEMAQKAKILDKSLPVAYFVSGFAYRGLGEYMKALVEAEKAIEYDPNYANAHLLLATLLYYAGRPEEGLERVEQAMLINPHHPFNYTYHQGQALYILGRYEEAVDALEQAIASNPGAERVHVWLAAAYAQAGATDDAQWEADQILTMNPEFSVERIENVFPFKDPVDRKHFIEGLRKAGLS